MFTGIVEQLGRVDSLKPGELRIEAEMNSQDPWQLGESVAVNGCCLTIVGTRPLRFDLSEETLARTALGGFQKGNAVNLERAMKANGRFGGHIVQGHVDATGQLISTTANEQSHLLCFRVPGRYAKYVIEKGAIAIDGISLTVVDPTEKGDQLDFSVWVIPHTWSNTNLSRLQSGANVNVEFDVLAKYVERMLGSPSSCP